MNIKTRILNREIRQIREKELGELCSRGSRGSRLNHRAGEETTMTSKYKTSRRQFLRDGTALAASGFVLGPSLDLFAGDSPPEGFRPLFDGKTLAGWHPMPRRQFDNQGVLVKPLVQPRFKFVQHGHRGPNDVLRDVLVFHGAIPSMRAYGRLSKQNYEQ
jgi:hypothetical protein